MVRIETDDNNFVFEVVGWHKIWTFTNKLIIPMANVVDAYPNEQQLNFIPGLRLFGTGLPGVISAGTYYIQDKVVFCDVMNYKNSIVVELRDEYYKMLVIEVEEPMDVIRFLIRR
ncbi:MAG: hypothetical protein ACTIJ9_07485 [Aequorivita sp.]